MQGVTCVQKSAIAKNALLLTGSDLLLRLMGIGFHAFLTHRIGAEGLGLMQLISSVGFFAIIVGSSGVRVAAMCLTAEEFGKGNPGGACAGVRACLRYGLCVSSLAATLLFLSASAIATQLLGGSEAAAPLRIMALFLPFSCLCGVMAGYFTACGKIRQMVGVQLAERLFSMAFTAFALLRGIGGSTTYACSAILLGSSLGSVLEFSVLFLCFRRDRRTLAGRSDPGAGRMGQRLRKLCLPLALNDYLRAGLNTAEQLLIPFGLAKYGGSSTDALAAHGTIHAMVFPVLMFPAAILYSLSDLLVPELSRSRAMGRSTRIQALTDRYLHLTWLFACAVAGFLFCCAEPLGLQIYGSEAAGRYLRIFAPMVPMLYLDAITDGMLKGLSQQLSCVRYNSLTSGLDVLLLFFLLPRWGIGGYLFSFALCHGINLFLSLRRLLQVAGHRLKVATLVRSFLCLLGALWASARLPAQPVPLLALFFRGGFFLCLLCGLYLLSGAIRPRELHRIKHLFLPPRSVKK